MKFTYMAMYGYFVAMKYIFTISLGNEMQPYGQLNDH